MYRDPFPSIEKAKEICGECKRFLCEELLWQRIYITPDKWGVPFDCPLRTEDEWLIRLELNRLPERTVSDFSGQVWGRHNYVTRYANMENLKADEIDYIIGYVRQNQCIIICKSVFPEYKAWKLFGFWSKCDDIDDPVTAPPFEEQAPASQRREEKSETPLTPTPAKTVPTFELTNSKFRHADDSIAKERPKAVAEGDTIRLTVATKNIPNDEVVAIKVHNVAGTYARTLSTLEARVKNGLAEAEWVVARDTKQDETELEWDAVYQGVECARGKIEWAVADLKISLDIEPDDPSVKNDIFILYSSDDIPKYKQRKTVKDDAEKMNNKLDLIFKNVDISLAYTLEIDIESTGNKEILFKNRPYGSWV